VLHKTLGFRAGTSDDDIITSPLTRLLAPDPNIVRASIVVVSLMVIGCTI